MERRIANYTVIFEKEKRTGTNQDCWVAYVPILGIATEGDTLEDAQKRIKSFVKFHLESLASEGEKIPFEKEHPFVSRVETILPKGIQVA